MHKIHTCITGPPKLTIPTRTWPMNNKTPNIVLNNNFQVSQCFMILVTNPSFRAHQSITKPKWATFIMIHKILNYKTQKHLKITKITKYMSSQQKNNIGIESGTREKESITICGN